MDTEESYKIRPAGRHILTIGRDLIQDKYLAIVELVKNAYDADSADICIEFSGFIDKSGYVIKITDHGHGMTRETVLNKWLVPSTYDKVQRRLSPAGRTMQGRKGIGRYAVAILGNELRLETVADVGEETILTINWSDFETADFLDSVPVMVSTQSTDAPSGTVLTVTGDRQELLTWPHDYMKTVVDELRKLVGPKFDDSNKGLPFSIQVKIDRFLTDLPEPETIDIEPYPILELYDYRISGMVYKDGSGLLEYSTNSIRNSSPELIEFNYGMPTECGNVDFDFRVYDRDHPSLYRMIERGLKNSSGEFLGINDAKRLLNSFNGVRVYREGFRIGLLGDPAFDWLELNKRRVQNPSLYIGSDQIVGYVSIQPEEQSDLTEKSARDGLRQNLAYVNLIDITQKVLTNLESRRFDYRRRSDLTKAKVSVERDLEKLFALDELQAKVLYHLDQLSVSDKVKDEIIDEIRKEEQSKNKIIENIKDIVAIYQGQATLGKIINVILHEGRRPLNYFKNQIPNIQYWSAQFRAEEASALLDQILPKISGIGENADTFVKLFSRLDPLAAGKRGQQRPEIVANVIHKAIELYESELATNRIVVSTSGAEQATLVCWKQDIYTIFVNLIDNSIYWMTQWPREKREISIVIRLDANELDRIDYCDSGPGIERNLIESSLIFEPHFTTKTNGTGLGLAIAGEAASRCGFDLRAHESESGAYFSLQRRTKEI